MQIFRKFCGLEDDTKLVSEEAFENKYFVMCEVTSNIWWRHQIETFSA